MMLKQKYIRTDNNIIIVFPELLQHTEFKSFNPISAGFISINTQAVDRGDWQYYYETTCKCYGESVSLGIKSNEAEDSALAEKQILGHL